MSDAWTSNSFTTYLVFYSIKAHFSFLMYNHTLLAPSFGVSIVLPGNQRHHLRKFHQSSCHWAFPEDLCESQCPAYCPFPPQVPWWTEPYRMIMGPSIDLIKSYESLSMRKLFVSYVVCILIFLHDLCVLQPSLFTDNSVCAQAVACVYRLVATSAIWLVISKLKSLGFTPCNKDTIYLKVAIVSGYLI